jgi:hypothetical protein
MLYRPTFEETQASNFAVSTEIKKSDPSW